MKKIILALIGLQTAIFGTLEAQNFEKLKSKYLDLHEIAFKVRIIFKNEFMSKPGVDEKFYKVTMRDSQTHQWINYNILHLDTTVIHFSIYTPESARIRIASYSDTFNIIHPLSKWDSMIPCLMNPPSNSRFTLSFPLVECFYPTNFLRKVEFKDMGNSWLINDYHPVTHFKRKVWINKTTGMVDSIYEYPSKAVCDRIYFDYYYTIGPEGRKDFSPLPDFYPLELINPKIMQIVNKPVPVRTLSSYDSSLIRKFHEQNDKLFLMDFWFIGCRPCHQAFPILEKLRKDYPETALDIVAFSPFDERPEIQHFKAKSKLDFDMDFDSLDLNLYYNVRAYPCTILINEKGQILYRHDGANENMEAELRKILDALID